MFQDVHSSTYWTAWSLDEIECSKLLTGLLVQRTNLSSQFGLGIIKKIGVLMKGHLVATEDLLVWIQGSGLQKLLHDVESKV